MINEIINQIAKNLSDKFDDLIIEGLKNKGYIFNNRLQTENFIKEYCRCEDNINIQQRIYYVKDIPFLLYNYELKIEYGENNSITASSGTYKIL